MGVISKKESFFLNIFFIKSEKEFVDAFMAKVAKVRGTKKHKTKRIVI